MHPLLSLWLVVLGSTVVLSGFFYMAENYAHIIGNFYFLFGTGLGIYLLILFMKWMSHKNKKSSVKPD